MSSETWTNPRRLVVISGSESFLWNRELQLACREASKAGRRVIWVEGADPTLEVEDALDCAGTFGEATLVVVRQGVKLDQKVVQRHGADESTASTLLLLHEGDLKKQPPAFADPSILHLAISRPGTRREREKLAARFAGYEVDRLLPGSKLDPELAEGLVNIAGTDLGIISHEILKATSLAKAQGSSEVQLSHIRDTIRVSAEMDLRPLAAALVAANAAKTIKALHRLKGSISGDPMMLLLRGRGGPGHLALEWLAASYLLEKRADPQGIAERLGVPRWAVERDVIPAARRWGTRNLRWLVHGLSEVEGAVLRGSTTPWVALIAVLAGGCRRTRSR